MGHSGTTGPFKGVMLSHRNIIANVIQLRQGWADYWEPRPTGISFLVRLQLLFVEFIHLSDTSGRLSLL